jgi:hypothetical protein
MGRKQKLVDGLEEDVIYARKIYKYLKNRPSIVKWAKRRMNKRMRRYADETT